MIAKRHNDWVELGACETSQIYNNKTSISPHWDYLNIDIAINHVSSQFLLDWAIWLVLFSVYHWHNINQWWICDLVSINRMKALGLYINIIGQLTVVDVVPITWCARVRYHIWLNMIYNMIRLAQFLNKRKYTVLVGLYQLRWFSLIIIYFPRTSPRLSVLLFY